MAVSQISEQGRATQGVKLIRVDEGDEIAAITQLDETEEQLEEVTMETIAGETAAANDISDTDVTPGEEALDDETETETPEPEDN